MTPVSVALAIPVASFRSVCARSAFVRFAFVRVAFLRSALLKFAPVRFAPVRLAPLRSAFLRSACARLAWIRKQPDRFLFLSVAKPLRSQLTYSVSAARSEERRVGKACT